MRPVVKSDAANAFQGSGYSAAKRPLVENIGKYCSYCERKWSRSALEVEHVIAKDKDPNLVLSWDNFLISCRHCNILKSNKTVDFSQLYFPHLHNTYSVFQGNYGPATLPRESIDADSLKRANKTIELLQLDRTPDNPKVTDKDDRWEDRVHASTTVQETLEFYESNPTRPFSIRVVINQATAIGYWSIWMDAFAPYTAVQDALIAAFPGTYPDCRNGQIERT